MKRDSIAIALLALLWGVFFWRVLTPIEAEQSSFKQGDFSAQFVAFGGYQYERLTQGEIPLWNPYNNGGLPFIGDTQAAVFYPPRLVTIAVASVMGGWTYHVLEIEAILHVLVYSLLMYVFIRRLTLGREYSVYGAFIGAVIAAYGGFIGGYPPLQLALLEAAIWLPLGALGILEATRTDRLQWRWLCVAGFGLGVSWLAGHPQTSWFLTYLLLAWLIYRVWRYGWRVLISSIVVLGIVTLGVTAVTFLPSAEYLMRASRGGLSYAEKANGFPLRDVLQFIVPRVVSLFSPLYVGLSALVLVGLAVQKKQDTSRFWFGAAVLSLLHSFGGNFIVYPLLYYVLPGLYFFRGQERAAFVVANSLAILAGLGAVYWAEHRHEHDKTVRYLTGGLILLLVLIFGASIIDSAGLGQHTNKILLSLVVASALFGAMYWRGRFGLGLFALLVVVDLFSVTMNAESNYDAMPPSQQLSMTAPDVVQVVVLDDAPNQPYRVDGFRGLEGNYGSLYGVMDMRGISPLFLGSAQEIIYQHYTNNPLAWELFAVRYVFSERENYGTPTTIIGAGVDRDGHVFVHELDNPRPFTHLVYDAEVLDSDEFAFALLRDPNYDERESVIIVSDEALSFDLPDSAPENSQATVTNFAPEQLTITVDTGANALLSLAQVDYPGWYATLDGESVDILRAYGTLTAVYIPAGEHELVLTYNPLSYRVGAVLSLVTWGLLAVGAGWWMLRKRHNQS